MARDSYRSAVVSSTACTGGKSSFTHHSSHNQSGFPSASSFPTTTAQG